MVDFRPIFLVIGILLAILGVAMLFPALYAVATGEEEWAVFVASALLTLFVGVSAAAANRARSYNLNVRQAFLLTTLSWVVLTAFAALPLAWAEVNLTYADAYFEAMSGITTTGATVMTDLDNAPKGILLWRAFLQWLGGIGIIVMAVAILPMLQVGGLQLFRIETADTSEKVLPRAAQIAGNIFLVYALLSLTCVVAYVAVGMDVFDAVAHMMTTISTGGFSTYDASMGHFNSTAIEVVAVIFMIAGSLPFVLYISALRGQYELLLSDSQVRVFFLVLVLFSALAFISQHTSGPGLVGDNVPEPVLPSIESSSDAPTLEAEGVAEDGHMDHSPLSLKIRESVFNVVSIVTGTGFATVDYSKWSNFSVVLFFILMFIGGCAGSTTCGIKIFRFQVLFETVRQSIRGFVMPHGVFVPRFNGRPLPEAVPASVISFLFLFLFCFGAIALVLGLLGLDTVTALSATAATLCNVGPGLGAIVGPSGNFASLPDVVKWILSFAMLLGRLELFTVLVLFAPAFWRD